MVEHLPSMQNVQGLIPNAAGYPQMRQWIQAFPLPGAWVHWGEKLEKRVFDPTLSRQKVPCAITLFGHRCPCAIKIIIFLYKQLCRYAW